MIFIIAIECPAGTYNNLTGLANYTECIPCDPGKYCPSQGLIEPLADCSAGFYCELASTEAAPDGQTYGYRCPVGHYCEQGTRSPTPCPKGTYNSETGIINVTKLALDTLSSENEPKASKDLLKSKCQSLVSY